MGNGARPRTPSSRAGGTRILRNGSTGSGRSTARFEPQGGRTARHACRASHFIEVCLDERRFVWVMLHSGSRGTGNQIGQYFIEAARKALEKRVLGYHVPDQDLAFFVEGEPIFDDYIEAVGWAQDYARANREAMMERTLMAMREHPARVQARQPCGELPPQLCGAGTPLQRRRVGDPQGRRARGRWKLGIIPGSMGAKSFIVRGKGNADSFCSCSCRAGRAMSRTKARRRSR